VTCRVLARSFIRFGIARAGLRRDVGSCPLGVASVAMQVDVEAETFCVYVSDRLVLPQLHNRLTDIAGGVLSLDIATRDFIRANLGFR
jgi:hypothetical protein